jgi:threonine dehydrogenase-like Zn-dependent dehydrogenase
MRAIVFDGRQLVLQHDHIPPQVGHNEAIVDVQLAGICSTDLEITKGYFGFRGILGHEFVGTVKACVDPNWIGKRIVSSINFAPSSLPENECVPLEHLPGRSVLGILNRDGAMADQVAIPIRNLFPVPEHVSDAEAVFTEPLAAALRIVEQMPIRPDARIAVIGPGRLGMLVAGVLSLGGAHVTVLGRNDNSLALACHWKLSTMLIPDAPSQTFDCVVEATGNPNGLMHAMRIAKPCSTIVLKSTYAHSESIDVTPIVVNELKVQGSRCGPFAPALRLLERKAIPVHELIDRTYDFEQALDAFQHAARPGARKILIRFSGQSR